MAENSGLDSDLGPDSDSHLFRLKTWSGPQQPDASCLLLNWEFGADPCGAEDWLTLLEPHIDQAKEELPGLPLTFYPDDAEDPLWTQGRQYSSSIGQRAYICLQSAE
ncbi:hypothetical protein UY3_06401 [Chelonia mydas]|uniref:Uncharacterized protein n=1 Tax=Chelonia mydas TaxID=8469 RepID=M7BGT7_CHEMY|nr:hypothetical protein UY3_06401 [Chelonia mydas]